MVLGRNPPHGSGMTTSTPIRSVLRLEAALAFVVSIALYRHLGGTWPMFAALFLAPDLAMLGYLVSPRVGAVAYNATHTYLLGGVLAVVGWALGAPLLLPLAALSTAHVGFDRALGYGLKYASSFADTHLGRLRPTPSPVAVIRAATALRP